MTIQVVVALGRLRSMLAAETVRYRLIALARISKANFNPNQPRVPAGNSDGGQWTSGGGTGGGRGRPDGGGINDPRVLSDTANEDEIKPGGQYAALRTRKPSGGHHYMPRGVFRHLPLKPETRSVFEQDRTGSLAGSKHGWSFEHNQYNMAVEEHFNKFLKNNGITPDQMNPDQARRFLGEIKRSHDPRIRDFNKRIFMREIMHYLRRGPRRPD